MSLKTPSKIFPVDMGELFGDWIPYEWQRQIFDIIELCPEHTFQLLTKQPQNLPKFSPFPENCWVGVTATDGYKFVEALDQLCDIQAKVIYLSVEPLLHWHIPTDILEADLTAQQVNQVIIGAQTKPYKPPKIEWVQEIVEAADKAGVPVFLKDNLEPLLPKEQPFYSVKKWHAGGGWILRQEFPE